MRDDRRQPDRGQGSRSRTQGSSPSPAARADTGRTPAQWELPLPADTQDVLKKVENARAQCENVGLLLERYIEWGKERGSLTLKKTKEQLLGILAARGNAKNPNTPMAQAITALNQRGHALIESLKASGYEIRDFKQKPVWRLVVGLGGASVLETAITLHPVYGIPIIPGSSLKGLARAYAEASKAPPEDIDTVFGPEKKPGEKEKEAAAGEVIFFDAYPTVVPSFERDIMNVHYADYYSSKGKKPPADYLSPTPILFLTVGQKTEFRFILASRRKKDRSADWVSRAEEWLKGGLKDMGVGAKTMVGYGYFNTYPTTDKR